MTQRKTVETRPSGRGRVIRFTDEAWEAGERAAETNNEELAEAIRRFVAQYAQQTGDGYRTEYRAISRNSPEVVTGITGQLADLRRRYPAEYWRLESCLRSPYYPVGQPPNRTRKP